MSRLVVLACCAAGAVLGVALVKAGTKLLNVTADRAIRPGL